VVVSTVQYVNNTIPVVTRIDNVTSTSFDIRLQNPSDAPVAAENVFWLVVEEGAWTIDGVNVEAQTYQSTLTDSESVGWIGEAQVYLQSYTNPVVLGQVMSENDSRWSVFWSRAAGTCSSTCNPPSATSLVTGKAVGEDPSTTRSHETVGFIVFEAGHGTIGGIEFEAVAGLAMRFHRNRNHVVAAGVGAVTVIADHDLVAQRAIDPFGVGMHIVREHQAGFMADSGIVETDALPGLRVVT